MMKIKNNVKLLKKQEDITLEKENSIGMLENKYWYILANVPQKVSFRCCDLSFFFNLVVFDKRNRLVSGILNEPHSFNTRYGKLLFKSVVEFYKNGVVKLGTLKSKTKIKTSVGDLFFSTIAFFKNGKIKEGFLGKSQILKTSVGNIKARSVAFYDNGKICEVILSKHQKIKTPNGEFRLKGDLFFYDNGTLKSIQLKSSIKINKQSFNPYDFIGWDRKGNFLGKIY